LADLATIDATMPGSCASRTGHAGFVGTEHPTNILGREYRGRCAPEASVERNVARSYSLRKRDVVVVDICRRKRFDTAKTQGKIRLVVMSFLPGCGDRITKGRIAAALCDTVIRDQ